MKWMNLLPAPDFILEFVNCKCIKGIASEVSSIFCGVPQGSVLGPLLFVLLINDLEFQFKYSQIILYADDAVIYFADKNISIIQERLNADLECISNWFSDNNLIVNLKKSKTECVLFRTHKKTCTVREFHDQNERYTDYGITCI